MVIEVNGEGKQIFKTYYSTTIKATIIENFGELKVTNQEEKSLTGVYVKVFCQKANGEAKFFRDGYTDIRGKFEYAQSSGNKAGLAKKFAILVQSDDYGSLIKEVSPP